MLNDLPYWLLVAAVAAAGFGIGGPVLGGVVIVAALCAQGKNPTWLTLPGWRAWFAQWPIITKLTCTLAILSAIIAGLSTGNIGAVIWVAFGGLVFWFIVLLIVYALYRLFILPPLQLLGLAGKKVRSVMPTRPAVASLPSGPSVADTRAQKRREDARARLELFYGLHAADIGSRFTQKMFDDYLQKYMGDGFPPEYVEERGARLMETLQKSLDTVKPPPRFTSLADINRSRQEERRMIIDSDLHEELKESQLNDLEEKYDELVKKFFQEKGQ